MLEEKRMEGWKKKRRKRGALAPFFIEVPWSNIP